jgi:phosphoribosylformylglycinamidine cyclo-ligase
MGMDYKQAGVNIDEGNRAVELIKPAVKSTHTKNVLNNIGGFAAAFNFPKEDYDEPILVSCTDGVGTKLRIAIESQVFDSVGIDLVAMCVNDLICMGAKPLFFLDYVAVHAIIGDQMKSIVEGIAEGCRQSQCALIGGEMAEMNDMYRKGDFDLAGFCVGVVDKKKVIDGSNIKPGDSIYALASSGIHSNGYSLVRKVLTKQICEAHNISSNQLLIPTKIYVKQVLKLIQDYQINGIVNITGGGLIENVNRILSKGISAKLNKDTIKVPGIFSQISEIGNVAEEEMYRVFNMGVGMVVVSSEQLEVDETIYKIGEIVEADKGTYFG